MKRTIALSLALILILLTAACGVRDKNPEYAGSYTLVYEEAGGKQSFGDDSVRLDLHDDGKGLDVSGSEVWDFQWSVRGDTVTIDRGLLFGSFEGRMHEGYMVFEDWGGSYRVYARDDAELPDDYLPEIGVRPDNNKPDNGNGPDNGEAPVDTAGLEWWARDWYGWWSMSNLSGEYANWDTTADCAASFEVAEDGSCTLLIWDEDWNNRYDGAAAIDIAFSDNYNRAYSTNGWFIFREVGLSDIEFTRGSAGDDNTLVLRGRYVDADGSFDYQFTFRPWGARWDDVPAGKRPANYESWYLLLVEAGAKFCPDEIGLLAPVPSEDDTVPPQPTGLDWWKRDWYGWWCISEATGEYSGWNDFADCGASFEIAEDGSYTMLIWDEDWGRQIDGVAGIVLEFSEDYNSAYSIGGKFMFKTLGVSDIEMERGNAADSATLVFGGYYEDEDGSFDYYFMLRPWGMTWDDGIYTLPESYYDWYLPLIEAGVAQCPDEIGH